jgi:hypothetical protein
VSLHRSAQESHHRPAIPALGDIDLEHFILVIDRAPGVIRLTVYLQENLVQVARPFRGIIVDSSLRTKLCREHRAKAIPQEPHRLMRDNDPALMKQVLDATQREREPDIHHHSKAGDLGGSLETFLRISHRGRLRDYAPALKAKFLGHDRWRE